MPKRTHQQNKALHKYCSLRAEDLDESGYDTSDLQSGVRVPFTEELVKKYLWDEVGPVGPFEFIAQIINRIGIPPSMLMPDSETFDQDGMFDYDFATPSAVRDYLWKANNPDGDPDNVGKEDAVEYVSVIFNRHGVDFRMVMPGSDKLKWEMSVVKQCLWKPTQERVVGKWRTRDLDKYGEIEPVHNQLEGNEEKGIEGYVPVRFPKTDYVEFPHDPEPDEDAIDYPDEDIDPADIPF